MTTIGANAQAAAYANPVATMMNGASLIMAAGVVGRFFNPLGAGAYASAALPSLWNLGLGTTTQPPTSQWSVTTAQDGKAGIELGDGYSLALNENNSEITITNAATGETTRIWGDPHVDIDGKHAYDFWGTTTFTLENGTKITINTEQGKGNPDVYYASQLVITKGDQAITVDGISEQTRGDLSIGMSQNGAALDAAHRDGFVLNENATGAGWRSDLTGGVATQADLNATAKGALYGPDSQMPSLGELGRMLGNYLSFGMTLGLLAGAGAEAELARAYRPR